MRPGDMARLGQLMVQRGAWRDQTLIGSAYLDELSAPSPSNGGYGFLTWVNAGEDFYSVNAPVSKYVSHPVWQNAPRDLYLQEFLRLVVASIVDVPPPPYVGPPVHGVGWSAHRRSVTARRLREPRIDLRHDGRDGASRNTRMQHRDLQQRIVAVQCRRPARGCCSSDR